MNSFQTKNPSLHYWYEYSQTSLIAAVPMVHGGGSEGTNEKYYPQLSSVKNDKTLS